MSIEVHVRIRPGVASPIWSSAETVLYSTNNPNTRYVYNKVHPSSSTNHNIFQGIEAMVHAALGGKNVTIMAYGQTGSGKTHSMIGTPADPGIVPRTAKLLLELQRSMPGMSLLAYYTEIYNESVKDLLEPRRGELTLHDAPDGGVYFDKKTVQVRSFDDFLQLQAMAERHRKYGVTNLNDHSSRSHIMLTFEIQRNNKSQSTDDYATDNNHNNSNPACSSSSGTGATCSVINLVDLAGSESAARAATQGTSLREGGFINRSLLALGNVVDAIVEHRPYIPYRDAKLTRILRSCLGGAGITFILCCIHPGKDNLEQTTATLRFTQRAMKIKNDPVVLLPLPPLFTHQYSAAAQELVRGLRTSCAASYQRGMRDAFVYAHNTTDAIVTQHQQQMGGWVRKMLLAQRLLIAHDHAHAIDLLGRRYAALQSSQQRYQQLEEQRIGESKRARELAEELGACEAKRARLTSELQSRQSAAETRVADEEYRLHEAEQQKLSACALLIRREQCGRAKVEYEWAMAMEQTVAACVPALRQQLLCLSFSVGTATMSGRSAADGTHNTIGHAGQASELPRTHANTAAGAAACHSASGGGGAAATVPPSATHADMAHAMNRAMPSKTHHNDRDDNPLPDDSRTADGTKNHIPCNECGSSSSNKHCTNNNNNNISSSSSCSPNNENDTARRTAATMRMMDVEGATSLAQLRAAVATAQAAVHDLELAHAMIKDELIEAHTEPSHELHTQEREEPRACTPPPSTTRLGQRPLSERASSRDVAKRWVSAEEEEEFLGGRMKAGEVVSLSPPCRGADGVAEGSARGAMMHTHAPNTRSIALGTSLDNAQATTTTSSSSAASAAAAATTATATATSIATRNSDNPNDRIRSATDDAEQRQRELPHCHSARRTLPSQCAHPVLPGKDEELATLSGGELDRRIARLEREERHLISRAREASRCTIDAFSEAQEEGDADDTRGKASRNNHAGTDKAPVALTNPASRKLDAVPSSLHLPWRAHAAERPHAAVAVPSRLFDPACEDSVPTPAASPPMRAADAKEEEEEPGHPPAHTRRVRVPLRSSSRPRRRCRRGHNRSNPTRSEHRCNIDTSEGGALAHTRHRYAAGVHRALCMLDQLRDRLVSRPDVSVPCSPLSQTWSGGSVSTAPAHSATITPIHTFAANRNNSNSSRNSSNSSSTNSNNHDSMNAHATATTTSSSTTATITRTNRNRTNSRPPAEDRCAGLSTSVHQRTPSHDSAICATPASVSLLPPSCAAPPTLHASYAYRPAPYSRNAPSLSSPPASPTAATRCVREDAVGDAESAISRPADEINHHHHHHHHHQLNSNTKNRSATTVDGIPTDQDGVCKENIHPCHASQRRRVLHDGHASVPTCVGEPMCRTDADADSPASHVRSANHTHAGDGGNEGAAASPREACTASRAGHPWSECALSGRRDRATGRGRSRTRASPSSASTRVLPTSVRVPHARSTDVDDMTLMEVYTTMQGGRGGATATLAATKRASLSSAAGANRCGGAVAAGGLVGEMESSLHAVHAAKCTGEAVNYNRVAANSHSMDSTGKMNTPTMGSYTAAHTRMYSSSRSHNNNNTCKMGHALYGSSSEEKSMVAGGSAFLEVGRQGQDMPPMRRAVGRRGRLATERALWTNASSSPSPSLAREPKGSSRRVY